MEDISFDKKELCENKYILKYLDLQKFLSFLLNKEFHFSRLDTFDDYLECSSNRQHYWIKQETLTADTFNPNPLFEPEEFKRKWKNAENKLKVVKRYQMLFYANCFYYAQNESLAMWNQYSFNAGVILKFEANKLIEYFEKRIDPNIIQLSYGRVEYDNVLIKGYERLLKPEIKDFKYNPYLKDVSFECENEFRFILRPYKNNNEEYLKIKLMNWDDINFTIILHPDIEDWKEKNIKKLLSELKIDKTIDRSLLLTKSRIQNIRRRFNS